MSIAEKFEVIADAVYEKGRRDEYNDFWDIYQANGERTDYRYAFGNGASATINFAWNETTFKPKYDIKPTLSVDRMFGFNQIEDLEGHLNSLGIKLDTSNCENMSYMFLNSGNKIIPEISLENAENCANLFGYAAQVITIRKVIFSEKNTGYASAFVACKNLTNIIADGVIAKNIDFKDCPLLTTESLNSITEHLKDFTAAGSGSATIIFHPDIEAKLGESGKAAITAKGWKVEFKTS